MPKPKNATGQRRTTTAAGDLLGRIDALARNLWWTWNPEPQRLFAALHPGLWDAVNHNPTELLAHLPPTRMRDISTDATLANHVRACEQQLAAYLRAKTWFKRTATPRQKRLSVAYFCAEFGLHECLPQYAGGLGILAGDHLKSASDLGVPLVAVGLLYRCGYYQQSFDHDGQTQVAYPEYDFSRLPISDTGQRVTVPLGQREIHARIWHVQIGRVPLYLLDTDLPENRPADRAITRHLYGGNEDMRIRQEIVLGIGGVRALDQLGIQPTVFHLNEGHAAFCTLERLRQLCHSGLTFDHAEERVWASTVFTTHTPVPAGHDRFPPRLVMRYLAPLAEDLELLPHEFLALGRENPDDQAEPFCMTVLALGLSERCNGVSRRHGEVSREMWVNVYGAARPADVPIRHVTNGVHPQTWLAPEIEPLYRRYLKPRWLGASPDHDGWQRADRIPPANLWQARCQLRRQLVHFVRQRLLDQARRRGADAAELLAAFETLDGNALTIGFARRFATYKRATLIFSDPKRLAALLSNSDRPVQLIFAGKAHPRDKEGQTLARRIHQFANRPTFRGRVVLLEDYDMQLGRLLTSGCDLWLNTPIPPLEASGTSGMKPPLNAGLNCSILDGWWAEAHSRSNGWAIGTHQPQRTPTLQNRHDAAALYDLLEQEIVPAFYDRDRTGLPRRWLRRVVASMQSICAPFSAHRMVAEYVQNYYWPAGE